MAAVSAKKIGDLVRVYAKGEGPAAIDGGWVVSRFEPDSGNAVVEKNGKRVNVGRPELDMLNFPGSDELWQIVSAADPDENLIKTLAAWTAKDLRGARLALIAHARTLDPSFAGVQTVSDLEDKIRIKEEAAQTALNILSADVSRAQREYDHFTARTALENDRKDNLLTRLENLKNQYDTHKYQNDVLVPAWTLVLKALKGLDALVGNQAN